MRQYRRIRERNARMYASYKEAVQNGKTAETGFFLAAAEGDVKVYHAKRIIRSMAVDELRKAVAAGAPLTTLKTLAAGMGGKLSLEPIAGEPVSAFSAPEPAAEEPAAEEPAAVENDEPVSTVRDGAVVGMVAETRRLLAAVKNRIPALLIGETGTGKTTIAKKVGEKLGREVVRVNLDGGVTPDEIIGRYQAKAQDGVTVTYFQEGVVPRAMRAGAILLLDELNAALPDTLFCLHSLLEAEPRLFIPETQEEIVPAEGFAIVATMNPSHEYAGTKGLNAALYSRFGMVIRFVPLTGAALRRAILAHVPAAEGKAVLERICLIIETVARLRKEEKVSTRLTLREGIAAARLATDGLTENEAVDSALLSKLEQYEREAVLAGGAR